MSSTYNIPSIHEKKISAIIRAGYYSNISDVLTDALRTLFEVKHELRLSAAIELYKNKEYTLGKCAEISGLTSMEFKEILEDRGLKIKTPKESKKEINKGVELIKKLRT